MKRGKVIKIERLKLLSIEVMKKVDNVGCKYLSRFELDRIKENNMKDKTIKGYKQMLRLFLKLKLNGKNKIADINE